jgi:predicted nucleic acid-binding protein
LLLDSSAWIEFFIGSEKGKRVKDILEKEECYASIVTLAEVTNWALKENRDARQLVDTIEKLGSVIKVDDDIAILAGKLNFERKRIIKKWGMLDSFILASGIIYDLGILTKDHDFDDLANVELL